MTREEMVVHLAALEQHLNAKVRIVRVVIAPDGTEVGRIYRGSFSMPPDWRPPTLDTLIATARGRKDD